MKKKFLEEQLVSILKQAEGAAHIAGADSEGVFTCKFLALEADTSRAADV